MHIESSDEPLRVNLQVGREVRVLLNQPIRDGHHQHWIALFELA
jgi:hypothetical protein